MGSEARRLGRLDRFGSLLGALALTTLLLHFGFPAVRLPPTVMLVWTGLLPTGLFVESLIRLLIVRDPLAYARKNALRYVTLLVILLEMSGVAGWRAGLNYASPSLVAGQIYLSVFLLAHMGSWARGILLTNRWLSNRKIPVFALPAITFSAAILAGALLLWMPGMRRESVGFLDSLFTATSAVCVTGLTVYDVGTVLTPVGEVVLAALIQLGGIGTMTVAGLMALWSGERLSNGERAAFSELIGGERLQDTRRILAQVVKVVLSFEAGGSIALWLLWRGRIEHPLLQAVFHAISAFCNAGFSLLPSGLERFSGDAPLLFAVMALIVAGGLGFPVVSELWHAGLSRLVPWKESRALSRNAKLVLAATAALLAVGSVGFAIDGWASGRPRSPVEALFQSVTTRTAGFQVESQLGFGTIGWAMTLLLMAIGAAPQSTGGGLKTSLVARLFLRVDPPDPAAPARRFLASPPFRAALLLAAVYLGIASASGLLIALVDGASLQDALFESFSALGTVGLSRDLTTRLSTFSRSLVILLMFIGRVLFPTLALNVVRTRGLSEKAAGWA